MKKLFNLSLIILLHTIIASDVFSQADWAHFDSNNKLVYKTDANGNRIMDFSYAGYMGGGVALPDVPLKVTLNAASGDQTSAIQNAINQVAAMPLINGFRGTVLLGPGTFDISKTININASGVVVRGSGSGYGGTIINMTGSSGYLCFKIAGSGSYSTSATVDLSDSYIPSGTHTFTVSDASNYKVGDNILIYRTVTQEWVHYLGMDTLTLNGQAQTWIKVGSKINTDRTITAISGNTITIDAPLTDNFDSKYLGNPVGTVAKYTFAGRVSQVGLEHLKIQAPQGEVVYNAITMDNVIDSWVSDVIGQETLNAFFVNKTAKRITLDNVINNVTVAQTNPAPTCDFSCTGTQILFNKCQSNGKNNWPATTMNMGTGPIVYLYFSGTATRGITPHMRWTTGLLTDNASLPNPPSNTPGVSYRNRGNYGSGHGWCTGWSVIWNAVTPYVTNSQAPGTLCWAIGGKAKEKTMTDPRGIFDHFNTSVTPQSLYLQQLLERLGQDALDNIGYGTPNKAPTVSITSPANNATFTAPASITINANAADSDGSISKVDFYNGTTLLGSDNSSPYSFAWNKVAAGTYSITAKATDNKGAVTTSTAVSVTVKAANVAPTVSITSPINNANFTAPASITINANATDSDGSISKVDFYNGSTLLGTVTASPYSYTWGNVTIGTYSITAIATDNLGATATSSSVTINVACAPTAIKPYYQVNGGAWQNANTVTIDAASTIKFGPQPTTGGSWSWTGPNGFTATTREVTLNNIQTSQAGNYVTSYTNTQGCRSEATFVVTVNATTANTAPKVNITSPTSNESFTEGTNVIINADASDSDGSISKVEFFSGTTKIGEDASSPYSITWTGTTAGNFSLTSKATDNKGASTTSASVSISINAKSNPCTGTATYVENGAYVAGSKVQNAGGIYQCKPYPYSGWCNGAAWAYAPGTGTYWTDAWDRIGTCTPRLGTEDELNNSIKISILPNPTSQFAQVKLNVHDIASADYSLINSLGVEVFKGKLSSNLECTIDLTVMQNGIYTIRFSSEGKVWMSKLVKQ